MTDEEQWPEDDPETTIGECAWCGKVRPRQSRVDPFVSEEIIAGDWQVEELVCKPCYYERLNDV